MSIKFSDVAELIHGYKSGDDISFLSGDESHRLPEYLCALANSSGGWAVLGASRDDVDPSIIHISGLTDPPDLTSIPPVISYEIRELTDQNILVVHVEPLTWHQRPVIHRGRVYRRYEGENIISGPAACAIMSSDSLSCSRDDFPVKAKLNDECVREFRETVTSLRMGYDALSHDEFLRRAGVCSGRYLTFAGALMLGKHIRVRAVLMREGESVKIEAHNIWRACTNLLPRLTRELSRRCADAFREAFVNSLLHSDYNIAREVTITIAPDPLRATIETPAIIRGTTRNHRLSRLFRLSGLTRGTHDGLSIITNYEPSFRLEQDMLNFRVSATIRLEGKESLPAPVML